MLKVYRFFKLIIISAAALTILAVLFYETTKENLINYQKIKPLTNWIQRYQSIKEFVFYDPYYHNISLKVQNAHLEFEKLFDSALNSMTNLTADKSFYVNIYYYMMSKKMKEMTGLARQYFGNIPSFKDLIIIDSKKNILYQLNSNTIIPEYYNSSDRISAVITNDMICLIKKYENPLDLDIEIVEVLDSSVIIQKIKEIGFETFFIMNDKIYKNADFKIDIIKDIQKDIKSNKKYISGSKIIDTYTVFINNSYIGTLGIIYPNRGIGSVLFIVLKIFILLLIAGILFIIDRSIEKRLGLRKMKKIKKDRAEESKENDTHLEWLENYVQKNEEKNDK